MTNKTIVTIAFAAILVGLLWGTPAVTATGAPDSGSEYQAPAPPDSPPGPRAADSGGWRCPNCGRECPRGLGTRGDGFRGKHRGKGRGGDFGHYGRRGRYDGRGAGLAADRLLHGAAKLELTDQQIEQLEKIAYDTRSKLIDLESELEKAQLEKRREMETNGDDVAAMKKHLDSIAKKRVDIQVLKLQNWIDAKKVLTEEQKQLIKEKHPRLGMHL